MKISSKARSAVMALVKLKRMIDAGESHIPLSKLANEEDLSLTFLEQLFHKLKKTKIVDSQRGSLGGYYFLKNPKDITIFDIIESVDTLPKAVRCAPFQNLKGCKPDGTRCATHHLWDAIDAVVIQFLQQQTLEDVCQKSLMMDQRHVS